VLVPFSELGGPASVMVGAALFVVRQLLERPVVGDQLAAGGAGPRESVHALADLALERVVESNLSERLAGRDGLPVQVERIADFVPAASGFAGEPYQVFDVGMGDGLEGVRGLNLRDGFGLDGVNTWPGQLCCAQRGQRAACRFGHHPGDSATDLPPGGGLDAGAR